MKNIFFSILFLIFNTLVLKAQDGQTNYVSKSFQAVKSLEVKLYSKTINIKTWGKNEVSIIAIIPSEKVSRKVEHDEWLTLSGIDINFNDGRVAISDKNFLDTDHTDFKTLGLEIIPGKKYVSKQKNGYFYFDGKKMIPLNQAVNSSKLKELNKNYLPASFLVMIPEKVSLNIVNEFGMLSIDNDVNTATIKGQNLTVIASGVQQLFLKTEYSSLSFTNINKALIDIKESRLFTDSVNSVDLNSSESIVVIGHAGQLKMKSETDEYIIRTADIIEGRKKNGRLTINVLHETIDVDAENANMSFNRMGAGLKKVNIKNKYANIRFGTAGLENYVVNVQGANTSAVMPLNSSVAMLTNKGSQNSFTRQDFVVGVKSESAPVFNVTGDYCYISFQ